MRLLSESRPGETIADTRGIRPIRICLVGIPGSGKTTTGKMLAEYWEVPFIHASEIAKRACPGDWIELGQMAPEPCTTEAVEDELGQHDEWILDGFPRTIDQWRSKAIGRESIVYLDISTRGAIKRTRGRGRLNPHIEEKRIREQTALLAPVKAMAAVIVPVTFRTPEQVTSSVIRWYLHNIHPSAQGSNAR